MNRLLTLATLLTPALATYYGCYREPAGTHALTGHFFADFAGGTPASPGMTIATCESNCTSLSFDLWALENTGECYCGSAATPLPAGAFPMFSSDCQMVCAGDASEICGGWGYFSLYGTAATPPALTPAISPPKVTYVDEGCNTEGTSVRALSGTTHASNAMTIGECGAFCQSSGFLWFGLEYSSECYCGNGLDVTSSNTTLLADSGCGMPCSGDATEVCGGPNRLSVYHWV